MTMHTYHVIDRATGELVFIYPAEQPIEWGTYPFALYDHQEFPYDSPEPEPEPTPPHVRLTPLEFLRRFTQSERIAMRAQAAARPDLADYLHMLDVAQEVFPDDPDTMAGVIAMEAAGIIAPGRANDILYG